MAFLLIRGIGAHHLLVIGGTCQIEVVRVHSQICWHVIWLKSSVSLELLPGARLLNLLLSDMTYLSHPSRSPRGRAVLSTVPCGVYQEDAHCTWRICRMPHLLQPTCLRVDTITSWLGGSALQICLKYDVTVDCSYNG